MVTLFRYRFLLTIVLAIALAMTLLFIGCEGGVSQERARFTSIGGEIVNPTTRYLILKRGNKVIDTIPLGADNKFHYQIENPEQGLYIVKHPPETQNLYIYPGDSLLFRVNTLAFDESIHFSGIGSKRNNHMKEMFLLDENNTDLILSYYKTNPEVFAKKTDSIYSERLRKLEEMSQKGNYPDDFVQLAQKVIQYESYDLRERYLYLIHKYYKSYVKEIPDSFTDYREVVDFNEKTLQCHPAYQRFIDDYLINKSLQWCAKSGNDYNDCSSLTNNENVLFRIREAAKLLKLPELQNHFLTKLGVQGVAMANNREQMIAVLDLLEKLNYNEKDLQDLRQMANIQLAYIPGTTLGTARLIDIEGEQVTLDRVVNKPTIIFLWSLFNRNHQKDHETIRDLRRKYPEINFVGVNVDAGETADWKKAVQENGYNIEREFKLGQTQINKKFFQYYLNKLLFLDASGKVVIGDAFINSPDLENRILEFLNK